MEHDRMIAVCDILGFTQLLESTPLQQVVSSHLDYFTKSLAFAVHQRNRADNAISLTALREQQRVGIAWFSDTVLVYSLGDSDEDCRRVIETVAWFLFVTMFPPTARIRAGIGYGELYVDLANEIFVGPAIVDAHRFEKAQEWAGGALTESAAARIPVAVADDWKRDFGWYLLPYRLPLKGEQRDHPRDGLAVDWTRGIHDYQEFSFPWSATSKLPTREDEQTKPDVVAKWRNTKKFHDDVCDACRSVRASLAATLVRER
jgi:hypothetical protein